MGGFEVMNEMIRMIDLPEWKDAWLDHAAPVSYTHLSDARFRAIQEIEKDVEYAIRKYRGFRKSGHTVAHDDTYIMIYHTCLLYTSR